MARRRANNAVRATAFAVLIALVPMENAGAQLSLDFQQPPAINPDQAWPRDFGANPDGYPIWTGVVLPDAYYYDDAAKARYEALAKARYEAIAKQILDTGKADDPTQLSKTLEELFSKPAFGPGAVGGWGAAGWGLPDVIAAFPNYGSGAVFPDYKPSFPPSSLRPIPSPIYPRVGREHIGIINITKGTFSFRLDMGDAGLLDTRLDGSEMRTFPCGEICDGGIEVHFKAADGVDSSATAKGGTLLVVDFQTNWSVLPALQLSAGE